jgi:ADP-heptose:LPS heptosyltransferase
MPENAPKRKKFLIVRFSSMGDVVLTTPVIRCLKQQYQNCEIHYLTKHSFSDLIINHPGIDKIFTIKDGVNDIIFDVKKEKYDLIIDLHHNLRSTILKIRLRRPSVTFNKLNIRKWLIVALKINRLPNIHIVDRMMKTVRHLGVKYDGQGLDYFPGNVASMPSEISNFITNQPNFFVFSMGGTYFTKRCPPEKVYEICRMVNMPVILIGGSEDVANAEQIASQSELICLNTCGKTSVAQSAMLIEKSKFCISNDTGMMHIAAALKKPIVSLWGNTIPEFGMTPFLPDNFSPQPAIIQTKGLKCRPCSKLGFNSCPKKHFRCMNDIQVSEITEFLNQNKLISAHQQ